MNRVMKIAVTSMAVQNAARYARREMDRHEDNKKAMVDGFDRAMQIAEKYELISADEKNKTAKLADPDLPDLNQDVVLNELSEAIDAIDIGQKRATNAAASTVMGHTILGMLLGGVGMISSMVATEIALGIGHAAINPVGLTVLGITAGAAIYSGIKKARNLFDKNQVMENVKDHIRSFKDMLSAKFNSQAHKDAGPDEAVPVADLSMEARTERDTGKVKGREKPGPNAPGSKMSL